MRLSFAGFLYSIFLGNKGGKLLNYRNGKDFLPELLLQQLQEYVEGELIYIPRRNEQRAGWGSVNGTRFKLEMRNREIHLLYRSGMTVRELAERYHLSADSIRKVLQKQAETSCDAETMAGVGCRLATV
jgi:Mor family transcriptional regulator